MHWVGIGSTISHLVCGWREEAEIAVCVVVLPGNVAVNPSYFEMALLSKFGGRVSDHKTSSYAISLAQFTKAQVSRSCCHLVPYRPSVPMVNSDAPIHDMVLRAYLPPARPHFRISAV